MSLRSLDLLALSRQLLSPRGRCNRSGFLVVALVMLGLQSLIGAGLWLVGAPLDGTAFWLLNAPIFWGGSMAAIKRLHDLGRTAWWIPAAIAFWMLGSVVLNTFIVILAGPERVATSVAEFGVFYWLMFATTAVPAFGGLIWLHASLGDLGDNAYGPPPLADGFSRPTAGTRATMLDVGMPTTA